MKQLANNSNNNPKKKKEATTKRRGNKCKWIARPIQFGIQTLSLASLQSTGASSNSFDKFHLDFHRNRRFALLKDGNQRIRNERNKETKREKKRKFDCSWLDWEENLLEGASEVSLRQVTNLLLIPRATAAVPDVTFFFSLLFPSLKSPIPNRTAMAEPYWFFRYWFGGLLFRPVSALFLVCWLFFIPVAWIIIISSFFLQEHDMENYQLSNPTVIWSSFDVFINDIAVWKRAAFYGNVTRRRVTSNHSSINWFYAIFLQEHDMENYQWAKNIIIGSNIYEFIDDIALWEMAAVSATLLLIALLLITRPSTDFKRFFVVVRASYEKLSTIRHHFQLWPYLIIIWWYRSWKNRRLFRQRLSSSPCVQSLVH